MTTLERLKRIAEIVAELRIHLQLIKSDNRIHAPVKTPRVLAGLETWALENMEQCLSIETKSPTLIGTVIEQSMDELGLWYKAQRYTPVVGDPLKPPYVVTSSTISTEQ